MNSRVCIWRINIHCINYVTINRYPGLMAHTMIPGRLLPRTNTHVVTMTTHKPLNTSCNIHVTSCFVDIKLRTISDTSTLYKQVSSFVNVLLTYFYCLTVLNYVAFWTVHGSLLHCYHLFTLWNVFWEKSFKMVCVVNTTLQYNTWCRVHFWPVYFLFLSANTTCRASVILHVY